MLVGVLSRVDHEKGAAMRSILKFASAMLLGLTAMLFVLAPSIAGAQIAGTDGGYTPPVIDAPPVVPPGVPVVISGTGFLPNAVVTITVLIGGVEVVLGTTVTDANGNWTFVITSPLQGGTTYAITGTDGVNSLTTDVFVTPSATPTTIAHEGLPFTGLVNEGLPFTGSSATVTLTQIGAVLVASGAFLALVVRKRRASDEKVKAGS
jgi:hypothetical protein